MWHRGSPSFALKHETRASGLRPSSGLDTAIRPENKKPPLEESNEGKKSGPTGLEPATSGRGVRRTCGVVEKKVPVADTMTACDSREPFDSNWVTTGGNFPLRFIVCFVAVLIVSSNAQIIRFCFFASTLFLFFPLDLKRIRPCGIFASSIFSKILLARSPCRISGTSLSDVPFSYLKCTTLR